MVSKWITLITFAVIIVSFLSFVFSFLFYYYQSKIVEKRVYYAKIEVDDFYGVDVNNSGFIFGVVPPGGASRRSLVFNNTDDFPILVKIIPKGDISKFVKYQEVRVDNKSVETVSIRAEVPDGVMKGVYGGSVEVMLIRGAR